MLNQLQQASVRSRGFAKRMDSFISSIVRHRRWLADDGSPQGLFVYRTPVLICDTKAFLADMDFVILRPVVINPNRFIADSVDQHIGGHVKV